MSGMGKTVVRKLGEKEVVCRELSVAQVRELLARASPIDLVAAALFEEIALDDLPVLTTLTIEEVEAARPSELESIIEGCKEANPHFFAMLARLTTKAPQPA